jgi:hypothetical protein
VNAVRRALAAAFLLVVLALPACAKPEIPCKEREPLSWETEVAGPNEPGERLVVEGAVYSAVAARALAGVTVYVYHADRRGDYGVDARGRFSPRLCGVMRTDEHGRYRFRTTMPGGGGLEPPHIHYEVWGPRIDRQAFVLMLSGEVGQGAKSYTGPRLLGGSRDDLFATTRPVARDASGALHAVRDLRVTTR